MPTQQKNNDWLYYGAIVVLTIVAIVLYFYKDKIFGSKTSAVPVVNVPNLNTVTPPPPGGNTPANNVPPVINTPVTSSEAEICSRSKNYNKVVHKGILSAEVCDIQKALNSARANLTVDGNWGSLTEAAFVRQTGLLSSLTTPKMTASQVLNLLVTGPHMRNANSNTMRILGI